MSKVIKNIFVLVVFIVLLAFGYFMFLQPDAAKLSFGTGDVLSDNLLQQTQVFIRRRSELEAVKLSVGLFTEPTFVSLRSYTTNISDQPIGKTDLFDTPIATIPGTSEITQ